LERDYLKKRASFCLAQAGSRKLVGGFLELLRFAMEVSSDGATGAQEKLLLVTVTYGGARLRRGESRGTW
jgi:hypothetical protein